MRNYLSKNKAIRIEKQPRKSSGPRTVYVFKCSIEGCNNELKSRGGELKKHSGKCLSHSHVKRPFESVFNSLKKEKRGLKVTLTYKQFIEFTKIKYCHYCGDDMWWVPYGTVNGKFKSRSYNLDRVNNEKGYSKENCVVSCFKCNKFKGTMKYEDFIERCRKIANIDIDRVERMIYDNSARLVKDWKYPDKVVL